MNPEGSRTRRWHPVWFWLALPFSFVAGLWPVSPRPAAVPLDAALASDAAAVGLLFGSLLDPNLATSADLELLPGIGPVRATAIAAHARRQRFESLRDLERVGGIGPKTVEKLAPWLEIRAAVADPHATVQALPGTPAAASSDAVGGKPMGPNAGAHEEQSTHGRTGR